MELSATCWALSWRPSKEAWAFPKSSWIQRMGWRHTGSSEQDRCVKQSVLLKVYCFSECEGSEAQQEVKILCRYFRGSFLSDSHCGAVWSMWYPYKVMWFTSSAIWDISCNKNKVIDSDDLTGSWWQEYLDFHILITVLQVQSHPSVYNHTNFRGNNSVGCDLFIFF